MDASPLSVQVVGSGGGPVADGARLFHDKGCEYCHLVSGYGGIRGPDLTYAGDTMTPAQMTTRIYSGGTNMPSYNGNLTSYQLSALLAFLSSRHRQPVLPISKNN
jgi:ubiquinol-cytochrome c reductase cytochrome b subunit